MIKGTVSYWSGFLPFELISPLLLHLPSSKRSLVRTKSAMWVHTLLGPIFFVLAVLFFAAGLDFLGLPGVRWLNMAFSTGREGGPPAVVFNKRNGYRFPVLTRSMIQIGKVFNTTKID